MRTGFRRAFNFRFKGTLVNEILFGSQINYCMISSNGVSNNSVPTRSIKVCGRRP